MADEEKTNWDYKSNGDSDIADSPDNKQETSKEENVSWSAKEFIEHDRSSSWYVVLVFGAVVLAVVIYFITKDNFAVAATVAVGIIAAVYAGHKPKELDYELTNKSIRVGERTYSYGMFKSFSVAREGEHTSIVLEPVKRFIPPMTLYFPPDEEKRVTNSVGNHLPMQEHQPNITERLSHRFRF
jgi:hypothetical protein